MNETYVTLRGWLGADVRHRLAGDTPVAEFRLGVTPRWFDSKRSEWVDAPTQWYTVKAWRHLADNCRDSLRRADPVVVHGRLSLVQGRRRAHLARGDRGVGRPRPVTGHQPVPPGPAQARGARGGAGRVA